MSFDNYNQSIGALSDMASQSIQKQRAILEQKEKGEDMAKTVGETKLFMSAHGIHASLKPVKPRIKKYLGRKIRETANKIQDKLTGDEGQSRRAADFKASQDELNKSDKLSDIKQRFSKLNENDKDEVRDAVKNHPDFKSKDEIKDIADEDEEAGNAAKEANTKILKDAISDKEGENFATRNVGGQAGQSVEQITTDAAGESAVADAASEEASSGAGKLFQGAKAIKSAAKDLAKSTAKAAGEDVAEEAGEETGAEVGSAALDAIPGADIIGAVLGAGIAIKKAIQVRKAEKTDENIVGQEQTGVSDQIGVV